jgi:hypothetical protein
LLQWIAVKKQSGWGQKKPLKAGFQSQGQTLYATAVDIIIAILSVSYSPMVTMENTIRLNWAIAACHG